MKVVLAFSGGLDTSYCARYLSHECGHDVYAVTINTGGFDKKEQATLERKAQELGVAEYTFIDETAAFYQEGVRYLLFGNVLKNATYPLSVSAERAFQALAVAQYAKQIKADAIAHGSTGAGNDQIRFDTIFKAYYPEAEIITPIRDNTLSREEEIQFLKDNGIGGNWEKSLYSINQGLWGTSVGGKETLTSHEPLPDHAYPNSCEKHESEDIKITFSKGEPVALNGNALSPVHVIEELTFIASRYAIGRDIHVGDTILGIKGRVGFEAAAPLILIKAHHLLEKHVLTKHQLRIKEQVAMSYGDLMHEGLFLDPALRDMEALLLSSQKKVTGDVFVRLHPYRFELLGISSPNDLMQSDFGHYGEMNKSWSGDDAKGFTKIYANQLNIYKSVHND